MARILLVDDDHELLQIARALMEHAGHTVTTCDGVLEALDRVQNINFDLVITDANMSPHSGFDLIRSLKQIPSFDLVPIAMLTGRREKRDVQRALMLGAQDYIVKPLEPELFIKKVTELIAKGEAAHRTAKFAEIDVSSLPMAQATGELNLSLSNLSETGCVFYSDCKLEPGTTLRLHSALFERIGVAPPTVRVSYSRINTVDDTFETRVTFFNLDDRAISKIRQFVIAKKAA